MDAPGQGIRTYSKRKGLDSGKVEKLSSPRVEIATKKPRSTGKTTKPGAAKFEAWKRQQQLHFQTVDDVALVGDDGVGATAAVGADAANSGTARAADDEPYIAPAPLRRSMTPEELFARQPELKAHYAEYVQALPPTVEPLSVEDFASVTIESVCC
eukprot:TRINITY_DN2804_c0_g2_i1.p2 TRINITY_DN2804_c0_g2~~TRINITY_DN2804_c0_g2_i1.p2  ORF type:complete len:156 (-),score=24.88 TRINITY_DN2804_c0_g2_i1:93-560(-)